MPRRRERVDLTQRDFVNAEEAERRQRIKDLTSRIISFGYSAAHAQIIIRLFEINYDMPAGRFNTMIQNKLKLQAAIDARVHALLTENRQWMVGY